MATSQYCAGIAVIVLMMDSEAVHVNRSISPTPPPYTMSAMYNSSKPPNFPYLTPHPTPPPLHSTYTFSSCIFFIFQISDFLTHPLTPPPPPLHGEEMVQPLPSGGGVHTHCSLWLEKFILDGWIHIYTYMDIYIWVLLHWWSYLVVTHFATVLL